MALYKMLLLFIYYYYFNDIKAFQWGMGCGLHQTAIFLSDSGDVV